MPGEDEQDVWGHASEPAVPNLSVSLLGKKAGDSYRRHTAVQDRGTDAV